MNSVEREHAPIDTSRHEATAILLVEDSPCQALQIRLILQREGYQVRVASDGAEGWRQAYTEPPHLILLDVELPKLDGFQVLTRLKHDRATANIPVVILTNHNHVSQVLRAIDLGADDFLPKEDAPFQLCKVIKQLLD